MKPPIVICCYCSSQSQVRQFKENPDSEMYFYPSGEPCGPCHIDRLPALIERELRRRLRRTLNSVAYLHFYSEFRFVRAHFRSWLKYGYYPAWGKPKRWPWPNW